MFYDGDLQSGITLAIQQARQVVCFITDDGVISETWEHTYLLDDELTSILAEKAVVLRLQAGSQEASFLAAFCPIDQVPVLVMIDSGRLQERIVGDIPKDEFVRRVRKVLGAEEESKPQEASNTPALAASVVASTTHASSVSARSQATPQTTLKEQSTPHKDKGKGKAPAAPDPSPISSEKPAELSYAAKQRLQKQEARQERERILAKIEADKAARRAKEQERRAAAAAAAATAEVAEESIPITPLRTRSSRTSQGSKSRQCRLHVRFFDGTSLRTTFPATATLGGDVREWIDKGDGQDTQWAQQPPYTFKHHDPPLPARPLDVVDEGKTLEELGLLPSATLVLIPVQGYTSAYEGRSWGSGGANGLFGTMFGAVNGVVGALKSGVNALGDQLARVSPLNAAADESRQEAQRGDTGQDHSPEDSSAKDLAGIKVRTLADQRAEERKKQEGQEWYNGNQVNLQPNKKDDDNDSKG